MPTDIQVHIEVRDEEPGRYYINGLPFDTKEAALEELDRVLEAAKSPGSNGLFSSPEQQ
jgi:hypothetical protein